MDFYINVVGLDEAYRRPQVQAGFLSNGNTHHDIGMVQSDGPLGHGRSVGLNHIAFELETEVDLVNGYERAIAAGITLSVRPTMILPTRSMAKTQMETNTRSTPT